MAEQNTLEFDKADQVVDAFGGVRPMATALGVPASTVQGWKERGAIPKARQKEVAATFDAMGQSSSIPVDHAIDAAAGMVDKAPFEADKETRNYQPPRSTGGKQVSAQGSSNLVLTLIFVALLGILGLLIYQYLQGVRGNDLSNLSAKFDSLEARIETLDQSSFKVASDVEALDGKLATIAAAADTLQNVNERIGGTTTQVEAVSGQLGKLAADVQARSEAQAQTISELSVAQTSLFESLSQGMVSQMTGISENLDQSVTDQMARLEDRAAAAREEAKRQQDIALANEQKARESAAEARAAEAAMAAGIRDVASVTQLRLALAENAPFADSFEALGPLANSSADIALAQGALGEYANGVFGLNGVPTSVDMLGQIDALDAVDRAALREAAGFGIVAIPSADDETTNQGKLALASAAISSGEFASALDFIASLEGPAGEAKDDLVLSLEANKAVFDAKQALDRWVSLQINGN